MKKLHFLLSLGFVAILGSLFTVLASNMFFSDIVNIAAGLSHMTMPVTIPATMIAVNLAVAVMFLIRYFKHPGALKALSLQYLIMTIAFNAVGIVGVILSATLVYGTLASLHPFPGYLIIFLVLHILLIAGSIVGLIFSRKLKDDTEKVKVNFVYVLATIGWFFYIMVVFNRFGTLLGAPTYIYFGNLYKTWPFYVHLALPLCFGVLEVLYIFRLLGKKPLIILTFVGLGLHIVLFTTIAILGMTDAGVVSALSPALPLERIGSFPMEMLIQFLSYVGIVAVLLVQNFKRKD